MPIDAVTFDFWDTICRAPDVAATRARRLDRIGAALDAGRPDLPPVDRAELEAALHRLLAEFNRHWAENRQFTYVHGAAFLQAELDRRLDGDARARLEQAITGEDVEGHLPPLTPNVAATIQTLRAAGVRIGIICDVGLAPSRVLRRHLELHGVLDLFDHWSFSDEVGWFKPAEEIFRHALDGLGGIEPGRAAHVGDLRRTDVAGALAMGMTAVRYAGVTDDPADGPEPVEADHVIIDHADLPAVLLGAQGRA